MRLLDVPLKNITEVMLMKIEMVREKEDLDPVSITEISYTEMIKSVDFTQPLFSLLYRDPIIEHILRIKPDYDFITRIAVENYCNNKKIKAEEYDSLISVIKDSIPDFYRKSISLHMRLKKPHNPEEVNWEKVKSVLPKKNKGHFPVDELIEPQMNYDDKQLLHIVEFFIECVLQTFLASSTGNKNMISFDNDIFRSIVAINITINKKKYHLGILDLVGSDYIAERCMEILSDFYGIEIPYESLSLNLDEY